VALIEEDLAPLATAEPVIAWRAWTLTGRSDGSHLLLRPVGSRTHPWPPLRAARAVCRRGPHFHQAPEITCTCGLHGTHGWDILRRAKSPAVLGTVAMWGRVVEHELGYRGEYAYPQRLGLVCVLCFWQWGLHGRAPDTVGSFGWGRLIPFCHEHLATAIRYGVRPRRVARATAIQRSLLDTYGVDLLAV
jgi:hypothetical protein